MARKTGVARKSATTPKKKTVLSRDYIDKHLPEEEFSLRDFERFEESAIFGWRVGTALMREARKDPQVKPKDGPTRIVVTLTFVVTPETRRNGGNCIRVGGFAGGPESSIHIPCLTNEGRRRYPARPK